ncbi:hypothetical protein ACFV4K_28030 [Nocardia sp. NPDC059764]|uniref:hypothetical protein n=1 Tax=Nocardia sp. NPDC059764 TaxID=3346939 RepID=UPI00365D07EE
MSPTEIMRARRWSFMWTWWPEASETDIATQFRWAAEIGRLAEQERIVLPAEVSCRWRLGGRRIRQASTTIPLAGPLDDPAVAAELLAMRGCDIGSEADIEEISISGPGEWIDSDGSIRTEDRLATLDMDLVGPRSVVNLEVHHDLWMTHNFRGEPHEAIHQQNSPRLANLIAGMNNLLGSDGVPSEPTTFGTPLEFGIEPPLDEDDNPMDVIAWGGISPSSSVLDHDC